MTILDAEKLKVGDEVFYRNQANTTARVIRVERHEEKNSTDKRKYKSITLDDRCGERYVGHLQVLINAANGIKTECDHDYQNLPSKLLKAYDFRQRALEKRIRTLSKKIDELKLRKSKCAPSYILTFEADIKDCEAQKANAETELRYVKHRLGVK